MGVSYNDFISAVANYYNAEAGIPPTAQWASSTTWSTVSTDMARVGITSDNYINYLENFPELFDITRNVDGTILDSSLKKYMYYGNVNGYNANTGGALNSNKIPSTFAESTGLNISGLTTKATTGALTTKGGIGLKADTGLTVQGVVSAIGLGALAVGTGATLGKIVGDALYEANPEIWDSHKISDLSKTDFNKFATTIKDDVGTVLHDGVLALWGVNGDTTTMYVDENALAYMTWYLTENNLLKNTFTPNEPTSNFVRIKVKGYNDRIINKNDININSVYSTENGYTTYRENAQCTVQVNLLETAKINYNYKYYSTTIALLSGIDKYQTYNYAVIPANSTVDNTYKLKGTVIQSNNAEHPVGSEFTVMQGGASFLTFSLDGYPDNEITGFYFGDTAITGSDIVLSTSVASNNALYYALCEINGLGSYIGYDGISENPNSKQFNPTGVGSVATALGALKNQYPDLWNNSIKRNTIQDDGSEDERIYVPIPIPKFNNPFDEKPTTGTPSQSNPSVNPDTTPKDELDNVSDTTTKDPTKTDNPNTGGGDSPNVVLPTQQASSLWAIYNPTLGQLNNLGAWLWSTNFIDQILKIFNDPMQAIIGLHKVYATPNISGSGNIKVGYLDSGVPSNIVGNQYTYIDCGTVSLREYYGNILDYSPYTTVQLYLPFIGIVSLDIADVSRSSITVKYGVDVLTGACLASVSVQRDNAGGVLYQYSGNCACQYPLSSGSYMGMITGALGAIGSLARGNIIGTGLSVAGMHTNIERSGGFSGNAGAMGIKKPYLIISRPQSSMNDGFPSIQGYPSNYFTRLGNCSGFTQIAECHVENISATDKELDKIKDLLKEGVII